MTLTDFLIARITEDEAGAKAAVLGHWDAIEGPSGDWWVEHAHLADIALDLHGENARHIARHDPARVLAECEAKRRILESSSAKATALDRITPGVGAVLANAAWDLRNIAAVYADHPDYREEWKP